MNVVIVEDEIPAAEKLARYLQRYDENIEVLKQLGSVKEAVDWLKAHQSAADLIFMDIQLVDGKSFEIFNHIEIEKPIIFTTAFDEYAIDAFKVNSIDYLLKPIPFEDLETALAKFKRIKASFTASSNQTDILKNALNLLQQKSYKTRFMVKLGEHIKSKTTGEIDLFYAEGRNVYLVTSANRKFIIDYKLEELEVLLDPKHFFRVNRTFVLNINGFKDVVVYSNSRLKVVPKLDFDKEIIVSRDKVPAFKSWCDGM